MNNTSIKIALTISLLICLFNMPYWYYQLIRIFGTIGFAYLAYQEYIHNHKKYSFIFGAAAVLLNPIIKIAFGRDIWNIVDVVIAVLTIINVIIDAYNWRLIRKTSQ